MGGTCSKVSEAADQISQTMPLARDSLDTANTCLDTIKYSAAISTAISGMCTAYKTIDEKQYRDHLTELGQDISNQVQQMNQSVVAGNCLGEPEKLSRHVYCMAKQQINDRSGKGGPNYFFIFHPANVWHAEFKCRLEPKPRDPESGPLSGLCGIFDNIEAMAVILRKFREVVGDSAFLYILVPTAHVYVCPEKMALPTEIGRFKIIGEKADNQQPFVYLVGGEEWKQHVEDVGVLPSPAAAKVNLTTTDKIMANAAGTGAGTGGAIAGAMAGSIIGPVGTLFGAAMGGALAGMTAKEDVENNRRGVHRREQEQHNAAVVNDRAAMR